jgi:hypothetical protein
MIEQMSELMAKLAGLPLPEKQVIIDEAYTESLRLNKSEIEKIDNNALIDYLIAEKLNIFQIEWLGQLLLEEGKLKKAQNLDPFKYWNKALTCLIYSAENSDTYNIETEAKINKLRNWIKEYKNDVR